MLVILRGKGLMTNEGKTLCAFNTFFKIQYPTRRRDKLEKASQGNFKRYITFQIAQDLLHSLCGPYESTGK